MEHLQVHISRPVCFRLSAEYGGTLRLNRTVDELVMDDGKIKAVKSEGKASGCCFGAPLEQFRCLEEMFRSPIVH